MNIGLVTIQTFTREYRAKGHRVVIFAPEFPDYEETDSDVWRFPSRSSANTPEDRIINPFRPSSMRLISRASKLELDVMHTHTPFALGIAMLTRAKQKRIPVVHTYHTLFETYVQHYAKNIPEGFGRYLVYRGSRTFCNRHDHIIAPSRAMARVLKKYKIKKPISVIPSGIDLTPFKKKNGQRMRKKLGFAKTDPMLLTMGRVAGEKNLSFLLDVMHLLKKKQPRAKLVIAGAGPGLGDLQTECKLRKLDKRVLFVGYVQGQDWVDMYAAADLHLLASVTETQGLTLTEAMAAGTPCVAVAAMGVRDVMAGGGGLMTALVASDFTNAVHRLLKDEKFYKQKKAEAKALAKAWSIEKKAEETLAVYEKVIRMKKKK